MTRVIEIERPRVRLAPPVRRLPAGVTESYSKVTYRPIERPTGGANVYRHIYGQRATFCIDGLNVQEARDLMLILLAHDELAYIGKALGEAIFPEPEYEPELAGWEPQPDEEPGTPAF